MTNKLFVYGTLRHPGATRFGLGAEQLVATDARLKGFKLFDVSWFPGIQKAAGDDLSEVVGDVFEVPEAAWGALDSYEGAPHLYRREVVDVEGVGLCQTYVYNQTVDPTKEITNGDWRDAKRNG